MIELSMQKFTHVHSSGRYDAAAKSFTDALKRYVSIASLITVTEVHLEAREKLMRHVGDSSNFGVVAGDQSARDDCGIMYDKEVWDLVAGFTKKIVPNNAYKRADGTPVQASYAVFAVLRHKVSKKVILVSVAHLPPTVEGRRGFGGRSFSRARAWRTGQKNWKAAWNMIARNYNVDGVLIVADWNLDIKRWVVRTFLKRLQPGMTLLWGNGPYPSGGTLGRRIIDATWIRGTLKHTNNPYLLDDDRSSDHRPYAEQIGIA